MLYDTSRRDLHIHTLAGRSARSQFFRTLISRLAAPKTTTQKTTTPKPVMPARHHLTSRTTARA